MSADGVACEWDSSGQLIRSSPKHTLGIVSLSVPTSGDRALFNSIEGLTKLWDLNTGEIVGTYEGYVKSGPDSSEPGTKISRVRTQL